MAMSTLPKPEQRRRLFILWLAIAAFGLYFSWYTILRLDTLNAYTADLSLIDQAMWNTLHGRFMEATWWDRQQPRLAEHFEPLLIPIAALFWLWDDVRVLLIVQAFALALGAWPVYLLARDALSPFFAARPWLAWAPLGFVGLYLFSPPLQAAAVADFHADPLAVAPLLLAFWAATRRRWWLMWLGAILVMASKETLPTLVVMLGGYLLWAAWRETGATRRTLALQGLGLATAGTTWFAVATFGIVAPLAGQHFTTDGPIYLSNRFSRDPLDWLAMLQDPVRWRYLWHLLLSTGGLALLAPWYLLLGLPVLVANTFSNFAGQYSGEQHYSAPLVAVLIIAAVYGLRNVLLLSQRLQLTKQRQSLLMLGLFIAALLLAGWHHYRWGWTPLSRRAEVYTHNAHTRQLPPLLAQVPPQVPISASAAVHPHLAHRPVAYVFPHIGEAEIILVDVLDVPGHHPNDVKRALDDLLASGEWRLVDAVDGFVLLQRAAVNTPQILPDAFYSFARAPEANPQFSVEAEFGNAVRLLGFDLVDDPFHQQTSARVYWQALRDDLPPELTLWPQFYSDDGLALTDPQLEPPLEAVWYPPAEWQRGEIIVTETLPHFLGERFHLAAGVARGPRFDEPAARLPLSNATPQTWLQLASFERENWAIAVLPPTPSLGEFETPNLEFQGGLQLTGLRMPPQAAPEEVISVVLRWEPTQLLREDYTVFIHVLAPDNTIAAQIDAAPAWLHPNPTTLWPADTPVFDRYQVPLPAEPGTYRLRLGLYTWPSLQRLPLTTGEDSLILDQITVINE